MKQGNEPEDLIWWKPDVILYYRGRKVPYEIEQAVYHASREEGLRILEEWWASRKRPAADADL